MAGACLLSLSLSRVCTALTLATGIPLDQCFGRDFQPLQKHARDDRPADLLGRVRDFVNKERLSEEYQNKRQTFLQRPAIAMIDASFAIYSVGSMLGPALAGSKAMAGNVQLLSALPQVVGMPFPPFFRDAMDVISKGALQIWDVLDFKCALGRYDQADKFAFCMGSFFVVLLMVLAVSGLFQGHKNPVVRAPSPAAGSAGRQTT